MSSLTELAAELVRIDSVNPDLVPGGAGEAELARFVADWLEDAGLEVEVEEVAPGRPNVVGRARGSGLDGRVGRRLAHGDTGATPCFSAITTERCAESHFGSG